MKLNISETDHSQEFDLALSVIDYFRLDIKKAKTILTQVKAAATKWKIFASDLGISSSEKSSMESAFRRI